AAGQWRARRPAPGLEYVLLADMRLGVFLVGIAGEPRIRLERVGDPFPDVADHLPAADRTVAAGQRADVDGSTSEVVEVRALGLRRCLAPGEAMLTSRRGIESGRHLPFRLGRQPPPRPTAERLRLVPVHVHYRMPGIERDEQIDSPPAPAPPPT